MVDKPDSIWLKGAVAGGIWATFEIIVGSMLHNLHLPFSGTILATCSVILVIAFFQVWPENGIIWRAGLICGLMKSLSPSAVILGPMTGIMMEAAVMDLLIFLSGRHLAGYMLAGAGALLSAILHKLINLFILYGSDLVTIYSNLFRFLKNQLSLSQATPEGFITGFVTIYLLLGIIAGVVGYLMGKFSLKSRAEIRDPVPELDPFRSAWNEADPGQAFRGILLFLHAGMIPLMLFLVNRYGLSVAFLLPAGIYTLFLLFYYKRIKYRLLKPFFWMQIMIMVLVAGLFYRAPGENTGYGEGFLVGTEMAIRAILIVSSFSALSVEIRNPRVTGWLLGHGMGNAYAAVSLAFNSLPAMIERSASIQTFFRNPVKSFSRVVAEADWWLKCYQTHIDE